MSLQRAVNIVLRRSMASSSSKSPTTINSPSATKDGDSEVTKNDEHHDEAEFAPSPSGQTKINYNKEGVGFKADKHTRDTFFNPLLTPPPRGPKTPDDFRNPERIGHWRPFGFDYTDPVNDRYQFHTFNFAAWTLGCLFMWIFVYSPDFKHREWARREAFLRTAKREALGLPLIDPNVVDPDRIVLPTEEELKLFNFPINQ